LLSFFTSLKSSTSPFPSQALKKSVACGMVVSFVELPQDTNIVRESNMTVDNWKSSAKKWRFLAGNINYKSLIFHQTTFFFWKVHIDTQWRSISQHQLAADWKNRRSRRSWQVTIEGNVFSFLPGSILFYHIYIIIIIIIRI